MTVPRPFGYRPVLIAGLLFLTLAGCASDEDRAVRVLAASIDRYGGDLFDDSYIRFEFRGARFEVLRQNGRFRYERTAADTTGRLVTEVMENTGTWIEGDAGRVELDSAGVYRVETDVNSVVYFGFLPFRLDDPAVVAEYLDEVTIAGEPYHEIEVTFRQEDGGVDWDTHFIYWIHADDLTLDYLAYRYTRDGGGTRFRRAVDRREVGGLLVQDWENYAAIEDVEELSDYDELYEAGELELLSMIELEDVRVVRADDAPGASEGSDPAADAPDGSDPGSPAATDPQPTLEPVPPELEGVEIAAGVGAATYAPGDSIRVVIELVNRASETRTLEFSSSMRYDIVVHAEDDTELFRWSDGRAFAQVLGELELEPGEAVSYEETVPAPDAPGDHRLRAVVPASASALEVSLPIEITP